MHSNMSQKKISKVEKASVNAAELSTPPKSSKKEKTQVSDKNTKDKMKSQAKIAAKTTTKKKGAKKLSNVVANLDKNEADKTKNSILEEEKADWEDQKPIGTGAKSLGKFSEFEMVENSARGKKSKKDKKSKKNEKAKDEEAYGSEDA